MAIYYFGDTLSGAATDDYLIGWIGNSTGSQRIAGGGGRDVIFGDSSNFVISNDGSTTFTPNMTGDSTIWTRTENADIAQATGVSHASAIIDGNGTVSEYRFDLKAGQKLTVDIDHSSPGLDTVVQIFRGTEPAPLATFNDAGIGSGAGGSATGRDSFGTFAATAPDSYYVRITETGGGGLDAGESCMVNFSLTRQVPDQRPFMGSDTLYGGSGNDAIYGAGGADRLWGGTGVDRMYGGSGNDKINGGSGNDVMTGGNGADRFDFAAGHDRITDFRNDRDTLALDDALWGGGRTKAQVLNAYADDIGNAIVFDFGMGETLRLSNYAGSIQSLANDLVFT